MWDLFISHASENKEELVKPLASALRDYGVKVWYDEFELRIGDSLSKSIDRGLIDSRYGLVILSREFFAKEWPDYELRSLLMKNANGERAILPVQHKMENSALQKHSLYLSDLVSLSSDLGVPRLAEEIVKVVRPDVINNHLLMHLGRKHAEMGGTKEQVPLSSIRMNDSQYRHTTLPHYLVIACRLIEEVLHDVTPLTYQDMVENFARDWDYDREFIVWSAMANAYMAFIRETGCDFHNIAKKKVAFGLLISYSLSGKFVPNESEGYLLSLEEQIFLLHCYKANLEHINNMIGRWK